MNRFFCSASQKRRCWSRDRRHNPELSRHRAVLYTGHVRIWLDLPDDVVEQLHAEGQDLSRAALEALAIDAYRMNRITAHQLCRVLGIPSRYDLDGFLKHHGVPLEYSLADFDDEAAASARLWQKRRDELSSERNGDHPAE
jgi:predicted HTH domain antitoxin